MKYNVAIYHGKSHVFWAKEECRLGLPTFVLALVISSCVYILTSYYYTALQLFVILSRPECWQSSIFMLLWAPMKLSVFHGWNCIVSNVNFY